MKRLIKKGAESWEFEVKSGKSIPMFELTFLFAPKVGVVACEILGEKPPQAELTAYKDKVGYSGWKFSIKNAPPNGKYILGFKRKRREKAIQA